VRLPREAGPAVSSLKLHYEAITRCLTPRGDTSWKWKKSAWRRSSDIPTPQAASG